MHRGRRIRQQLQPVAHTRPMPLCLAGEFPELGPLFCPSLSPTLLQQPLQRMPLELICTTIKTSHAVKHVVSNILKTMSAKLLFIRSYWDSVKIHYYI